MSPGVPGYGTLIMSESILTPDTDTSPVIITAMLGAEENTQLHLTQQQSGDTGEMITVVWTQVTVHSESADPVDTGVSHMMCTDMLTLVTSPHLNCWRPGSEFWWGCWRC